MSFNFPAGVERDIEKYAQAEHISPSEAAVRLVKEALKTKKPKAATAKISDSDWSKFEEIVPGYAFFQKMPDGVIDQIARASKRTRTEKLTPRG